MFHKFKHLKAFRTQRSPEILKIRNPIPRVFPNFFSKKSQPASLKASISTKPSSATDKAKIPSGLLLFSSTTPVKSLTPEEST